MSHLLPRMMKAASAGLCLAFAASAGAQATATGASAATDSKFEVYAGYGYWNPFDNGIHGNQYATMYKPNATGSLTYYFSHHFGFQFEGEYFAVPPTENAAGVCTAFPCQPNGQKLYSGEGGPVFRYPKGRLIPFAHVLGGGEKLSGPVNNPLTWGWIVKGGIGVDYVLPFFHNLIAVRPIQADFQYQQVSYGPLYLPANTNGGFASFPSMDLSAGLVVRLGGRQLDTRGRGALSVSCDATPGAVYPGDVVTVTGSPMNENPKHPMSMRFSTGGGQLTPTQMGATIGTTGLAPGDYAVAGSLMQGKHTVQCNSSFTVKPFDPPTLTCSADPATVPVGGVATITAAGTSLSNRPMTYTFTTDGGQLSGTGASVQLATAGATSATVNVTCNVADDLGKTGTAKTSVSVTTPVVSATPSAVTGPQSATLPPPLASTQTLCAISFERDKRRPVRVDNEAKACLDDIALNLQQMPDAKMVIVGNFGDGENATEGAERSLNVKQYLTDEKGIDASRIEVRYGTASGRTVDDTLIPAGTSYSNDKMTTFDPKSVKRVGQAYSRSARPVRHNRGTHRAGAHRRHRHHKAATADPVAAPTV